jgi:hypothetical protein
LLQYQELLAGLVRLHILHRAAEGEIYGVWIFEELARHGYRLSPGTLYPMLRTMERKVICALGGGVRAGRSGGCIAQQPLATGRSKWRKQSCASLLGS